MNESINNFKALNFNFGIKLTTFSIKHREHWCQLLFTFWNYFFATHSFHYFINLFIPTKIL